MGKMFADSSSYSRKRDVILLLETDLLYTLALYTTMKLRSEGLRSIVTVGWTFLVLRTLGFLRLSSPHYLLPAAGSNMEIHVCTMGRSICFTAYRVIAGAVGV